MPALRRFAPDLILVSAGFDGHARDPLAGMALHEDDYAQLVHLMLQVQPRLCAVLEGGYNLQALPACVLAVLRVLVDPAGYAALLTATGCAVDAWETTYLHQLTGETPVLDWITGTALTDVRSRLSDDAWEQYRREIIPLLARAYPPQPDGTTFFPFRRIFVVAQT